MKSLLLKNLVIGMAAGTLLLGFDGTVVRFKGAVESIRDRVRGVTPTSQLVQVAAAKLEHGEVKLAEHQRDLRGQRARAARLQAEIGELGEKCGKAKERLAAIQPVVAGRMTSFERGGCSYSATDVANEAEHLITSLNRWHRTRAAKAKELREVLRIVEETQSIVDVATNELVAAKDRFHELKLQLESEEVIAELTPDVGGLGEVDSEFQKIVASLETRLDSLRAGRVEMAGDLGSSGVIAWEETSGTPGLADRIARAIDLD